ARPFLSSIPGVPAAGRKFMRQLFRLEKGQIGVVENDADTIVYVARIVEETPSIADRRQMFASTGVTAPLVDIGRTENLTALSDWYQRLSDQYSVEWKRQPHVDSRRAAN
ncbi:MAG: hypothetical protein KDA99_28515, partial [Planctomycetales bacterium]|nr:hypothetical protein [Planctomycetales bacterium]